MSNNDAAPGKENKKHEDGEKKVNVNLDYRDNWVARQKNSVNYAFDRFSPETKLRYIELEEHRRYPEMLKKCQDRREYLMKWSPTIRFMNDKIAQMGGRITKDSFLCTHCVDWKSGDFDPILGMMLCANKLYTQNQQEDTMAHELVHVYDHLRFDVNWCDLRHNACSEVRASSLSGECKFMQEFWKNGQYKFHKGYQDCVKRRAILSMVARPGCRDKEHAAKVVNEVFDSCMMDTRPFDEVYR